MADILYAPNRERVVTTNAWAFLHWLGAVHGVALADWAALQRFSIAHSAEFRAAISRFARLPREPLRLTRHAGTQEALAFRRADGSRHSLSRDALRHGAPDAPLAPLARLWPPDTLVRALADTLLYADLRPDDRLLVFGPSWPWLAALLEGTAIILAPTVPAALPAIAAEERATVLVAPAQTLAEAAFQRARSRPNLAGLRTIIATGGPLSPEGRRRIYAWVKSDVMLLARTGDTTWGNPLEPVLVRPAPSPALLTPPPSAPATR